MKYKELFTLAAAYLLVTMAASIAPAQEVAKDQVRCFSTWDENYFYLAFKVDCPDVRATHSKPNESVDGDDSITVYIETDGKRAEKASPSCFSMTISPAGGAQFRAGTGDGKLEPATVWTFKYGANVQGTINNGDDIDMGYTVEMAIPWDIMNMTRPGIGDQISYNMVVRRHGKEEGGFVSLSPLVKTESDLLCPAKWSKLVFAAYSFGVATTGPDKILSAKYIARPPLINGVIGDKEWHSNTSLAIDIPLPPGVVYEAKFPPQRMVFTPYCYNYQADRRKAAEPIVLTAMDTGLFGDHPIKNVGPWFSYDRTQWHKEELSAMSAAGIDVVLPVFSANSNYGAKGLDCMVNALAELRAEGKPFPMVGMFLPGNAVGLDAKADKDNIKRAYYAQIKAFFSRVPDEYCALAPAAKPRAGQPGSIVFLVVRGHLFDSAVRDFCNESFERDFGRPLVWVAMADTTALDEHVVASVPKGPKPVDLFDGIAAFASSQGAKCDDTCRIRIGCVGAGFESVSGIRSRMGGDTYRKDWDEALAKNPNWVFCDNWNDFRQGSDLCASRQYDRTYIDATKSGIARFTGNRDFRAQYLRYSVPKVIPTKQFAQAELEIRNAGNMPWRVSDGFAVGYRWYKSGRYYGESKVRRPLDRDVEPGETVTVNFGVATVNAQAAAMPDGAYELRIELIRLSDNKWFSVLGDQPLIVPLIVGPAPDWGVTYLAARTPVMAAAAQSYAVKVRVRNDGSQLWPKGVTKLACKLYKVASTQDGPAEEVPMRDCRALLAKDCKPGEIAEFTLDLDLTQPDKKPIESMKQGEPWGYQLRFDIFNGEKWLSEIGGRTLSRAIDVFDTDYGPRIVDCDLPKKLTAGQTSDVKIVIRNTGVQTWDRKRTKIGYHWYHLDGAEMAWDGILTPIKANIQPGISTVLTAKAKAPDYDGQYVLVWDIMIDDVWQSTQPLSRGGDILPVFVEVTGGKLAFADLSGLYDVNATSPDTDRTVGDFDGKGSSFPAEHMPPDAGVADEIKHVYPSGYQSDVQSQPDGRISFSYPDKLPGAKNAIACSGQKALVEKGSYVALHILCASSSGAAKGDLSLNYNDGSQAASIEASDWTTGPTKGEKVACMTRHRHTHGGDEIGKACYLYHYTLPLDPARTLTSMILPNNPSIKVVALTLERPAIPTFLAPAPEKE
ncbi:MAG: hypothetical protein M1133_00385 [Armatimonadetes bacterium]|nr:hypothetical protein [Armatimonadota bacterium]